MMTHTGLRFLDGGSLGPMTHSLKERSPSYYPANVDQRNVGTHLPDNLILVMSNRRRITFR